MIRTDLVDMGEGRSKCYYLDQRVVDIVKSYAEEQKIVDQREMYNIAAHMTQIANGILSQAKSAVNNGQSDAVSDFVGCNPHPKYNQLIGKIVASIWGLKLTPLREESFSICGPNIASTKDRYTTFRIEWQNANEQTFPKPKFAPFKPSNASDFSVFQNLRQDELFTDVTLCCEDGEYPAHRVVLAARSDFFKSLLVNQMKESLTSVCTINARGMGTDRAHLEEFLDFLYTEKVELKGRSIEDIEKLLTLSKAYFVEGLTKACIFEIASQVNADNVDQIESIGKRYVIQELINLAEWYKNSPLERFPLLPRPLQFYYDGKLDGE